MNSIAKFQNKDYSSKQPSKKQKNSEVLWYTEPKRKKQAEIIQSVIDEEIKSVPSKDYECRKESNADKSNSKSSKRKRKQTQIEDEPPVPTKRSKFS